VSVINLLNQLPISWRENLQQQLTDEKSSSAKAEQLNTLIESITAFRAGGDVNIYPAAEDVFAAFKLCSLHQVKVVILGQDPYHGPGQANGLSFSVADGVRVPPSLNNIFKEQATDLHINNGASGNLTHWAKQGVLLLNSVLTVEAHKAGSHQGLGWELLTDAVITALSQQSQAIVFMLWGKAAQHKARLIQSNKHCILTAPHPSPLSAYRGFFGCQHFSQANAYLQQQARAPIDWQLP